MAIRGDNTTQEDVDNYNIAVRQWNESGRAGPRPNPVDYNMIDDSATGGSSLEGSGSAIDAPELNLPSPGQIYDDLSGRSAREEERRVREENRAALEGLWTEEMSRIPELYGHIEGIAPEMMGASSLEDVRADPEAIRSQMAALRRLESMGRGELTRADISRLQQEMRAASEQERGQREAVLQNLQERGTGGGGAEIAAMMQAQQSGANRAADFAAGVERDVQNRALGALESGSRLASQLRSQGVSEAEIRGRAQQARNLYNTTTTNEYRARETDAQRRARENVGRATQDVYGRRGSFHGAGYTGASNAYRDERDRVADTDRAVAGKILDWFT